MKKVQDLLQIVQEADTSAYRPVVFWSVNADLQEGELCRQLREMRVYGLGGVIFHARAGLTTEYLSEEWFRLTKVCLDEARANGLGFYIYDEFGWPSGFVGGRLLREKDNCARYLEYKILSEYDENAYAVYALNGDEPRLLAKGEKADRYHTLYLRYSNAYADILNPQVVDAFIAATHEEYYKRFSEYFGKELVGFFTDEPQYYRYATPISKTTEAAWEETYGTSVKEGLLYLFLQTEKGYPFRVRYYNLMNRLYCENFYKKLYDWCESHGCLLTGHSVEETGMFTQMWGGADCATSYLYEHIPAIDNLTRFAPATISGRNVGSVAAQCGRTQIMTETFGCSGYVTSPRDLRAVAEKQYVHGVNLMCQHLYNYSLAGQGKLDFPLHFGRTLPWVFGYPSFNDYFAKLGWLLGNSKEEATVALVTPMESVYLDYLRLNQEASKKVDRAFSAVMRKLKSAGIAYHFVNEKVLQKIGRVEGDTLIVGECRYSAIVLGSCRDVKQNTVRCLQSYLSAGGKLVVAGEKPRYIDGEIADLSAIQGNCEIADLPRPSGVKGASVDYTVRVLESGKRFVFAVNSSGKAASITVGDGFSKVCLETGKRYDVHGKLVLQPHTSVLLEEGGTYGLNEVKAVKEYAISPRVVGANDNCLTIDQVCVTMDNGDSLQGYVYGVFETLVRRGYKGRIHVQFPFESEVNGVMRLTIEKQPIGKVYFNNRALSLEQSEEDINLRVAEIPVRKGVNTISYTARLHDTDRILAIAFNKEVPESLRNCFSYHTCIEPLYIHGKFDTRKGKIVAETPKCAGDLTAQGYEHFYGCVEYEFDLPCTGRVLIQPVGAFAACELLVGDQRVEILLDDRVEVTVDEGVKKAKLLCYSSLRNRFGPFHSADGDELGISPDKFTLCFDWTDDCTNHKYVEEKILVPFGLDKILVKSEK